MLLIHICYVHLPRLRCDFFLFVVVPLVQPMVAGGTISCFMIDETQQATPDFSDFCHLFTYDPIPLTGVEILLPCYCSRDMSTYNTCYKLWSVLRILKNNIDCIPGLTINSNQIKILFLFLLSIPK